MPKTFHEIRDPIHVFIKLDSHERRVLDSRPFQRLRSIHQLALTYLVYPGASHKRFEHSLGTSWMAHRIVEAVRRNREVSRDDELLIRVAALLHDITHIPFGHTLEDGETAGGFWSGQGRNGFRKCGK